MQEILTGKLIYLDIATKNTVLPILIRALRHLGANIEEFYSHKINLLVTDNNGRKRKAYEPTSHQAKRIKLNLKSNKENIVNPDVTFCTDNRVLDDATKRGVTIKTLQNTWKWLETYFPSLLTKTHETKLTKLLEDQNKVRYMNSPGIKLSDVQGRCRPLVAPKCNYTSVMWDEAPKPDKPAFQNRTSESQIQSEAVLCRCCRVYFRDLYEHLHCESHQSYADDDRNFSDIDAFIANDVSWTEYNEQKLKSWTKILERKATADAITAPTRSLTPLIPDLSSTHEISSSSSCSSCEISSTSDSHSESDSYSESDSAHVPAPPPSEPFSHHTKPQISSQKPPAPLPHHCRSPPPSATSTFDLCQFSSDSNSDSDLQHVEGLIVRLYGDPLHIPATPSSTSFSLKPIPARSPSIVLDAVYHWCPHCTRNHVPLTADPSYFCPFCPPPSSASTHSQTVLVHPSAANSRYCSSLSDDNSYVDLLSNLETKCSMNSLHQSPPIHLSSDCSEHCTNENPLSQIYIPVTREDNKENEILNIAAPFKPNNALGSEPLDSNDGASISETQEDNKENELLNIAAPFKPNNALGSEPLDSNDGASISVTREDNKENELLDIAAHFKPNNALGSEPLDSNEVASPRSSIHIPFGEMNLTSTPRKTDSLDCHKAGRSSRELERSSKHQRNRYEVASADNSPHTRVLTEKLDRLQVASPLSRSQLLGSADLCASPANLHSTTSSDLEKRPRRTAALNASRGIKNATEMMMRSASVTIKAFQNAYHPSLDKLQILKSVQYPEKRHSRRNSDSKRSDL